MTRINPSEHGAKSSENHAPFSFCFGAYFFAITRHFPKNYARDCALFRRHFLRTKEPKSVVQQTNADEKSIVSAKEIGALEAEEVVELDAEREVG